MKVISQPIRYAVRITTAYLFISATWIFFSDRLLGAIVKNNRLLLRLQTYKGWFFVIVTSLLLFYLIRKSTSSLIKSRHKIEESLREKQTLLSELHHRVKNNLAVICSLIDLQTDDLDTGEAKALQEIQYRIYTLADIEELLYQNKDVSQIPFHIHLKDIISSLEKSKSSTLSFNNKIEEVYLNIDQAIPLGLLCNEIFSQLRLQLSEETVFTVDNHLSCSTTEIVHLDIGFGNISSSVLERVKENGHLEKVLMDLYTKQLDSTYKWLVKDGAVSFTLNFEKL